MADKFPALDDIEQDIQDGDADFLKREQELLGDEFRQPEDAEVVEDDEVSKFESQFPSVESDEEAAEEPVEETATQFETLAVNDDYSGESDAIRSWKESRTLEISKRDEVAAKKKESIKEEAQKAIDDFYDNYNNKKELGIEETRKAETEFLEERDNFLSKDTTVWDRVLTLVNENESTEVGGRDKTKFKELLGKLKGNAKAPGAAGY
ncbi:hypothetical protein BABINDRAFT_170907 [Babjeviella inositovora NRRL Y-12698]|uniref:Clathrin light chain n=1 Tax=Babjeviella inositovora NRRL Y-12698 TaxID=984486 RepID=A0A1E3QUY9_9ASCO|nr:uncharacterized protein BABINDRAFT_170907 [Babjeviella inositovora NRRL Y-12698]ODQ81384.1 hypothetical protein BABINDRAFT_170907 [Babjeviella inositovora NRRL Y-12698]